VSTKSLNISQSATLIGTLKANTYFNPRVFPERALGRRNVVIGQMKKYGYLSENDASKIAKEPLALKYRSYDPNQGLAPYFRAEIKRQLDTILQLKQYRKSNGETYNLYQDGLKVYTTLDNTLQQYAETAMKNHMATLQKQFE